MAALTYTRQRKAYMKPSRTFDHLYDPIYRASSNRDHMKDSFKAQTGPDKIRYMPKFRTMFSELRHHPRLTVTLDMTDPVPPHVSRHWNGFADQTREAMVRYKKCNYAPTVQIPPKTFEPPHVDGVNRYKYFRRPIIPFLPQMPPNVVLAPARMDPLEPPLSPTSATTGGRGLFQEPKTRSVLVQTDFRDSEAQTDPYAPEHVVRPGSQPELLTLASLSYGRGLPAGLAEVEMIERARVKRAWEASLPPLDDFEHMDKRRKMMEEQERKEWAFREQEIEKMQEERMELIKKMLQQREVDHYALNSKRMEHFWTKKNAERDRCNRRLHSNHVKALRKLTEQVSRVEGKFEKRDIIKQYSNFDSQVYAPMTRIGVYLDSGSEQYNVKSKFSTTLDGLMELEDSLPPDVLDSRFTPPVRSALKAVGMEARRQVKLGSILEQVYSEIISSKTEGKKEQKPLRLLKRVEKPLPRPATPTIPTPPANEEEKELALILLQRIIRGRAIQTKMFEGKERRQQLIRELRTTHALQSPEQKAQKQDAETVRRKQVERARQQHQDNLVHDGSEQPAATHLGMRLDFLTKELLRLQEERRIHAYVMLAERERRMREAEESGRRQREERVRRTEDEMFKQMMRVEQGTVDTYLQDVIINSLERTADEEARKVIAEKAKTINKVAFEFEHTELSGKELVAELVHAFLLPEVDRRAMKEKVQREQRKHLLAAHRIVMQKVNDVVLPETQAETSIASSSGADHLPVGQSLQERQQKEAFIEGATPAHREEQEPVSQPSHSDVALSQETQSQEALSQRAPSQETLGTPQPDGAEPAQVPSQEIPTRTTEGLTEPNQESQTSEELQEPAEPSQEVPASTEEPLTEEPAEPSQEVPASTEEPLTEEPAEEVPAPTEESKEPAEEVPASTEESKEPAKPSQGAPTTTDKPDEPSQEVSIGEEASQESQRTLTAGEDPGQVPTAEEPTQVQTAEEPAEVPKAEEPNQTAVEEPVEPSETERTPDKDSEGAPSQELSGDKDPQQQ